MTLKTIYFKCLKVQVGLPRLISAQVGGWTGSGTPFKVPFRPPQKIYKSPSPQAFHSFTRNFHLGPYIHIRLHTHHATNQLYTHDRELLLGD